MTTFADFALSPELQRAITEQGYETPSPIQVQALPILLGENTDFIGLAGTGTGKTAAFSIPMLEKIDGKNPAVQTLILCPTRELAMQVAGQVRLLGRFKGIKTVAVYGGASFGDQVYGLKQGATVVIGTPGRVIDHIKRGTLVLSGLKTVILDEADEMVSMGFKDELETILQQVPKESSNIWLFSATMSREVRRVADTYLRKPKQVQVNRQEMLSENVEQFYYVTQEANKPEVLSKLIEAAEEFYGLIFCQTKALVNDLTDYLNQRGFESASLHGDMDQRARERVMQAFRDRRVKMLVCTDVAARGLDVKDVTHVVNYSIPFELDSYVHRIGRTARSGKSGVAISLVTPANRRLVERVEFMTKSRMQQGKIPSSKDIGMKKAAAILPRFRDEKEYDRAMQLLDESWLETIKDMTPQEVVGRMLAVFVPQLVAAPEKKQFVPEEAAQAQRPKRNFQRGPQQGVYQGGNGAGNRPYAPYASRKRQDGPQDGSRNDGPRYPRPKGPRDFAARSDGPRVEGQRVPFKRGEPRPLIRPVPPVQS